MCGVMERAGRKFGRVPGDFPDGFFAELQKFWIEGARVDGKEWFPFDGYIVFGSKAA